MTDRLTAGLLGLLDNYRLKITPTQAPPPSPIPREPLKSASPSAFFLRADMPDGRLPGERMPRIAPALAVEVLSESNTNQEMQIKVREYFQSGARLVWLLDPGTEALRVYDDPGAADHFSQLASGDTLSAPGLLPGFSARVRDLFDVEGWEG
jgi:Uma2 family endonuclease